MKSRALAWIPLLALVSAPAGVAESAPSPSRDFAKEVAAMPLPEEFNRYQPFEKLLQQWAAADPIAALQWTARLDDPNPRLTMLAEVPQVAASPEAQSWVAALSPPFSRTQTGDALLQTLVKVDPEAAIHLAKVLRKPGEDPRFILGPILATLIKQDIHRALEIDGELFEAYPDKAFIQTAADGEASLYFTEVIPWSNHQTSKRHESIPTFREIFGKWAGADPDGAVKFFARHFHQSSPGYFTLDDILYGWSRHNREAASRWLEQSQFAKDETYARCLYTGPIEENPDEAAAWKPFPEPPEEMKITLIGGDLVSPVLYDPTMRRIMPMDRASPDIESPSEWRTRLNGGTRFILQVYDHHPSISSSCIYSRLIDTSIEGGDLSIQLSAETQRMTLTFAGDQAVPEYFKGNNEVVVGRLRKLDWPAKSSRWVFFTKKEDRVYSGEISNVQEGEYLLEALKTSPDDGKSPREKEDWGSSTETPVWSTKVRLPATGPLEWKVE
jgi:hypothetical protein